VASPGRPRLLAPEVVQTSSMDCGPAALKCLLDGFGLHASYGRLREACQTDVDGTSIDTLEDFANDVGLIAEQILLPVDHVLPSATAVLPAIVVVRQPGGLLHFVVAWRHHGPVVQVMDPASGRRWPRRRAFEDELYPHTMAVPAANWRTWAGSDLFRDGLRARARACGIRTHAVDEMIRSASSDETWKSLAALDSTLRMVGALHQSGALARGEAAPTLQNVWARACGAADATEMVPADYWTVRPGQTVEGHEHVLVRGAVLVRVTGVRSEAEREQRKRSLPREAVAALREPPLNPLRELMALLRADGHLGPAVLLIALFLAAAGVVVEALLFRGLIDVGAHLSLSGQRLATMAAVICLSALLLGLEVPIATGSLRIGRRLETRLRIVFLTKIPRLADRYFQSRPSSDMAERAHAGHQIRELPNMAAQLARSTFELLLTTLGIALLYPASAALAIVAALAAVAIPAVAQPWLRERDLRQRTHTGALTRFYLDAFLGIVPVRAHGAERALAREQEALLVEWAHAGRSLLRTAVATTGAQLVTGFGLAAWLLFARARLGDEGGGALLLAYWALNIPILGQEIAQVAWQYPTQRNLTLRLLEPLGALEEEHMTVTQPARTRSASSSVGVSIELRDVTVRAGGHTILEEASLIVPASSHVAIVGESGAGKSTLVGLLLGWHRPVSGAVFVDGEALHGARLDDLRSQIAWVDPAVQLWNRSLAENLEFGQSGDVSPVGDRIVDADLRRLVEQLPEGMQTSLGEGGTLVSGGEGQRVRFGRGLGRCDARLAILDEPFRGLERERRADLLRRARTRWQHATLFCVTHDISETADFDRVIVLAHGRIVEEGIPAELAIRPDSRYRLLLHAERLVRERLWADPVWRTIRLEDGKILAASHASAQPTWESPRAGEDDRPRSRQVTA
jgi:ABC-type bacteriocin/lantibiotic exporter with double-glycine peptidase domain